MACTTSGDCHCKALKHVERMVKSSVKDFGSSNREIDTQLLKGCVFTFCWLIQMLNEW